MKFIFANVSYATMDSFGYEGLKEEFSDYENIVLDYVGCEIVKIDRVLAGCYDITFKDGHKIYAVSSEHIRTVTIKRVTTFLVGYNNKVINQRN